MALPRPAWFSDRDAWWTSALGAEVAGRLEPLGIDEEGRLHLWCADPAWARQTAALSDVVTARTPEHTSGNPRQQRHRPRDW